MSEKKKYWHNLFLLISAILIIIEYNVLLVDENKLKISAYNTNYSSYPKLASFQKQNWKYFLQNKGNTPWITILQEEKNKQKEAAFLKNKIATKKIEEEKNKQKRIIYAKVLAAKKHRALINQQKINSSSYSKHNNHIDYRHLAPKPVSAKRKNGQWVCAKKHDHPHKSRVNNKGKTHLDMECCLDPDEYPNPWCTYSSKNRKVSHHKFSTYLRKKHKKK